MRLFLFVLQNPSKHGFLIVDAGGGTLDISAYAIKGTAPLAMEEIAPPDCWFNTLLVFNQLKQFQASSLDLYLSADAPGSFLRVCCSSPPHLFHFHPFRCQTNSSNRNMARLTHWTISLENLTRLPNVSSVTEMSCSSSPSGLLWIKFAIFLRKS